MSTTYRPMANGRDQTVQIVGKFYGSYVSTTNDRIGTFGGGANYAYLRSLAREMRPRQA